MDGQGCGLNTAGHPSRCAGPHIRTGEAGGRAPDEQKKGSYCLAGRPLWASMYDRRTALMRV